MTTPLDDPLGEAQRRGDFWKRMAERLEADRDRADKALTQAQQLATALDAVLARVRSLHAPVQHMGQTWCAECSVRRSTGPKTEEWVAFIPHPCPTLNALDDKEA